MADDPILNVSLNFKIWFCSHQILAGSKIRIILIVFKLLNEIGSTGDFAPDIARRMDIGWPERPVEA